MARLRSWQSVILPKCFLLRPRFAGAFTIDLERHKDERGFFARTFCVNEFAKHGLNPKVVQCNLSSNPKAGTLRRDAFPKKTGGRSQAGALRAWCDSQRRGRSAAGIVHVSSIIRGSTHDGESASAVIPESFGHGFQTLVDDTEVEYQMSEFHAQQHAHGFRYDDAAFSIRWPRPVSMISTQDLNWLPFS